MDRLSDTYDLFIVSNCQDGYIESFYEYHKLERYFKDYENPGRTGLSKGENIKLVIDRNNLDAPVYVGIRTGMRRRRRMPASRLCTRPMVSVKSKDMIRRSKHLRIWNSCSNICLKIG